MSTKEFKAPVTKRKQKEEEDFPRGGASGLTPLEYKEIAHQADTSLFSVSPHSQCLIRRRRQGFQGVLQFVSFIGSE